MHPVVVVTGAAKGIGFAIARRFLVEGAYVALNDRTPDLVQSVLEQLLPAYPQHILGCPADVRCANQVNLMVGQVIQQWSRIDILVNNAGIYPNHPFLEMQEQDWDAVMDINAKGVYLVSQVIARQMIALGVRGHIINISSGSYASAREGSAHYCASKAAGVMLTKVMAMELAAYGIRVNAVAPGLIQVENMSLNPAYMTSTLGQIPVGRLGTPEDVAEVVYQLAATRTDYLNGAVIAVDGGLSLGRYGIPRS
jgi:NAD(P)-dependent dehydrogenase (short-subunit alcohol dehydrogenase family)